MDGEDLGAPDLATPGHDGSEPVDDLSPSADLTPTVDLTPTCVGAADGTACANGGLCQNHICSPCADGMDAQCTAAYGSAYVCVVGGCVPGDCHVNSDCPTGKICDVTRPNFCDNGCASNSDCPNGKFCNGLQQCSGCALDSDCDLLGTGYLCNTATSTCVANTCSGSATCTANASDYCCGSTCVFGNCCSADGASADTLCKGATRLNNALATCVDNQCTACAAVTNSVYYVDPVNGVDATATGNNSVTAGCAFKTIKRALAVVGNPNTAATILIMSDVPVANAETNLKVGKNITIQGMTRTTKVALSSGGFGFQIAQSGAHLTSLVIDGGNAVSDGVILQLVSPSPTPAPLLDAITIQNMTRTGVNVRQASKLTIGADFISQNNGGTVPEGGGLVVMDAGSLVTIHQSNAALMPIVFKNNSNGLVVMNDGAVNLVGAVAADGTGTISFSNNKNDGILFDAGSSKSSNSLDGIVANSNGIGGDLRYGAGLQLANTGAAMKLRRSTLIGNNVAGVRVRVGTGQLGLMDLGGAPIAAGGNTDNGANTLQSSTLSNRTGICMEQPSGATKLPARGNKFLGGIDCTASTSTLNEVMLLGKCEDLTMGKPGMPATFSDIAWFAASSVDVSTCH
jgi:hypothetical protein